MLVVTITLAATFSMQFGYFLWKISADTLPRIGEESIGAVLRGFGTSGRWLLGTLATVIGWVFFVKATDLGEVSIVQPLMSVGDLFLVLLAVVFLHERLIRLEWVGLALTVIGACTLAFEAEVIEPVAIIWPRFLALAGASAVILGVCLALIRRTARPEVPMAIAVGIGFGVGAVLTELMTAYITLSGRNLETTAFFLNPILPFMVGANVIGLVLLQAAFQRGRAAVIVPVQLSVVNGLVIAAGIFVFDESITPLRVIGIAVIVLGTTLLHFAPPREAQAF